MGYLETADKTSEVIRTGEDNPKGLIGAIALAVIGVGIFAIKTIGDMSK